jgi:hypothetical protein
MLPVGVSPPAWLPAAMGSVAEDVEGRLAAAAERLCEYEATARRCAELGLRMAELSAHLDRLRAEHAAEHEQVERLQGMSLARVVVMLLGARDDRLARERAEAAAAYYRIRVAEAYMEAVSREYAAVRARLDQLIWAPRIYAAVLDEKEWRLRESHDARRVRLLQLAEERGRLAGELHEIGEALTAVRHAQVALVGVRDELGSALRWSTLGDWFGEPISGEAARSRLDRAGAAAAYADRCLAVLRVELADVGSAVPPSLSIALELASGLFGLWLDKTFDKAFLRDPINRAQQRVDRVTQLVADVSNRLARREAETRARLDQLEIERRSLLTRQ